MPTLNDWLTSDARKRLMDDAARHHAVVDRERSMDAAHARLALDHPGWQLLADLLTDHMTSTNEQLQRVSQAMVSSEATGEALTTMKIEAVRLVERLGAWQMVLSALPTIVKAGEPLPVPTGSPAA